MAGQSQVRGLRRVNKSSNLTVDIPKLSWGNAFFQATVVAEPVSATQHSPLVSSIHASSTEIAQQANPRDHSPIRMHHFDPVSRQDPGLGSAKVSHRYATVIDGVVRSPGGALHAVGQFATSAITTARSRSLHRPSRSRGRSFWTSGNRPSISEPSRPRLVSSVADPQALEQPLVRHTSLTLEGREFREQSTTSLPRLGSRHDVDTPDPLRCHPAQPGADVNEYAPPSPVHSSASYHATSQYLTTSQRWKRSYNQEHRLCMDLQTQLATATTELEKLRPELEAQRTRAQHFENAEAVASKRSMAPLLAMLPLEHSEKIAFLVKRNDVLEEQFIIANGARIRAEAISAKETKACDFQMQISASKSDRIDALYQQLDESQAELKTYKQRCEDLEAAARVPREAIVEEEQRNEPSFPTIKISDIPVEEQLNGPSPPTTNTAELPARSFSVMMRRMGRTQPEVNSSSNISHLLPVPSTVSRSPDFQPPGLTSRENKRVSQVAEMKIMRGSSLRSLWLPQRVSLASESGPKQEVPAVEAEMETEEPCAASSPFSAYEDPFPEDTAPIQVIVTEPFPAYEDPYPQSSTLYFHQSVSPSNQSFQPAQEEEDETSLYSTEPFPAYEEPYPAHQEFEMFLQAREEENPTLPAQTERRGEDKENVDPNDLERLRKYSQYFSYGFNCGRAMVKD
ncbi:uncharacterized protein LY89DRAFT_678223 [Mollisia scopiformis]|uniref:Uncharacterized protein n=1 Tax=Mollisia scopiformis TaxID=149040 RepID=A0A132B3V8_MOLSC|nr:uncharacterized protein LY89DRAFT_678223 [Mollisia scopiformis]KUJ06933.1 hypothetical protein LY89DRAFT_678223 [Mollisia scopiformis]